jgi:hypothetical protein
VLPPLPLLSVNEVAKGLLSVHPVTLLFESVNVVVSAASNHNEQPGIVRGSNPERLLDEPIITFLKTKHSWKLIR